MGNVFSVSVSTDDTVNLCYNCTATRVNYTRKLEKNLKALDDALQELKDLRDDVKRKVDRAQIQKLEPFNQVQGWLRRAETMIREAEELFDHGPHEIEKLCLGGYFSKNCKSGYKFGQQVASKLEGIVKLKSKGVFDKVAENEPAAAQAEPTAAPAAAQAEPTQPEPAAAQAEPTQPEPAAAQPETAAAQVLDVRPIAPTVGLESTLDKVWRLFEDTEGVGIVGLYGSGGVGKTTLLTQINNRLCSMPARYNVVIWVVVSKDYFIDKVQDQIGEKIGLSNELWKKKSCDEKATEIFRVLSKRKFVLLLDDLWKRVDLVRVGIPPLNDGSSSKLVFTTRSQDVCGEMEAHAKIRVACLGDEKSWKLFREKVGEQVLKGHPKIEDLAKRVAAECGGLPLALITIGRAMACKKSPEEWEYAINVLQQAAYKFTHLEDEVYPLLKFSYDSLPSDIMRSCLLYCSLYPEDHNIEKRCLINYWFYEGFLDEFVDISRARMQGYNILGSLVNACLLEEYEEYGECYVKMHDVIRDMTFWIAGGCEVAESRVSMQQGVQLIEATNVGKWKRVKRMLVRVPNQIKHLKAIPTCPNLRTLFLHYNYFEVIHGFFRFMPKLKVLDLSCNGMLRELPEGISELVSLECLNLSRTGIRVLPFKLKTLAKLRYLDLWGMPLRIIPRQLISSFSKLQVIKICLANGNEDVIEELGRLQHLKSASFMVGSVFALEKLLTFHNLKGCTEQLSLSNFSVKSFDVFSLADMGGLNILDISHGGSMEEMLDISKYDKKEMKKKIERVGEAGMSKVPYHSTTNACFHSLGNVTLLSCDKLKEVTWLMLAPNLTSLKVNSCITMEEIISEGKLREVVDLVGNQYPTPFRMLQSLTLQDLPKLKSIYWDALPFPFLKHMIVEYCPNLKKLPLNSASAKGNQITIKGENEWWEELEWEDESTRNAFLPSFKELTDW